MVDFGHQTQPERIARVVEDQAILGARIYPQAPADLLDVEHLAAGWRCVNNAANRPIDTRGQRPHRAGDTHLTTPELPRQMGTLNHIRVTVHITGRDARLNELLLKQVSVCPVDPEHECRPVLALRQPCVDHVGNQLRFAHDSLQAIPLIFPGAYLYPGQVRHVWREHREFRQIAHVNQRTDCGGLNKPLPAKTEALCPRRGAQAYETGIDPASHHFGHDFMVLVHFVNDDQIERLHVL